MASTPEVERRCMKCGLMLSLVNPDELPDVCGPCQGGMVTSWSNVSKYYRRVSGHGHHGID